MTHHKELNNNPTHRNKPNIDNLNEHYDPDLSFNHSDGGHNIQFLNYNPNTENKKILNLSSEGKII